MKSTEMKATKTKAVVKRPKTTAKAATGVRVKGARRSAEGKFTKVIFNQIGWKVLHETTAQSFGSFVG